MKDESTVQQEIQIEARYYGCTLLRNNSGALKDQGGRLVRFGLGNISKQHSDNSKSSDLIGILQIIITPEMVGKTVGVFVALEVKKEEWSINKKLDKHEIAQANFINWIRSIGGIASFCNSTEQLKDIFRKRRSPQSFL